MKRLYVLYDGRCELCRRVRNWLSNQPAFVPLAFVPLNSADLEYRFPGVTALEPAKQIIVIADTGEAWRGEDAWIMCLWALREYREWSLRLAGPLLRPLAKRLCGIVSSNRIGLSKVLFGLRDADLAQQLAAEPEGCEQ